MTVRGKPFRKGRDPRRHRFTTAERRQGFWTTWRLAMYDRPELLLWVRKRLRASRQNTREEG